MVIDYGRGALVQRRKPSPTHTPSIAAKIKARLIVSQAQDGEQRMPQVVLACRISGIIWRNPQ